MIFRPMIESFETWMYATAPHAPYLLVFVVLVATCIGLPLPEDVIVLVAGYVSGLGYADPWLMFPMRFITIMAADAVIFFLGRKYGHHVPRMPMLRRYITPERLLRMEQRLQQHGGKFIFTARFMPGVRTAAIFAAGILKVRYTTFVLWDSTAGLLTIPTVFFAAYFGVDYLPSIKHYVAQSQLVLGILTVAACVLVAGYFYRRKRKRQHRLRHLLSLRRRRQRPHPSPDTPPIEN